MEGIGRALDKDFEGHWWGFGGWSGRYVGPLGSGGHERVGIEYDHPLEGVRPPLHEVVQGDCLHSAVEFSHSTLRDARPRKRFVFDASSRRVTVGRRLDPCCVGRCKVMHVRDVAHMRLSAQMAQ